MALGARPTAVQMNNPSLDKQIRDLILADGFVEAERLLQKARSQAANASDPEALKQALDLLVDVYALQQPPNSLKADVVCIEREELTKTAYSRLQTAMWRYWAAHDYRGAIAKAQEAITQGKKEGDDSTIYSALSVLGLGSIQLGDYSGAADAILEIERMIADRRDIIVGDETVLLEAARAHGLSLPQISRIAAKLAPLCHDPEFARRLDVLRTE